MPVSAETLRALMAAGVAGDALVEVVEKIDADMQTAAPKRSTGAERQARHRAKLRSEVTKSDVTPLRYSDVTSPPNDNISNPPEPSLRSDIVQARKAKFAEFRSAYPRRTGANPWGPAEDKFLRLARDGENLDTIIDGARRYGKSRIGDDPKFT